MQKDGKKADWQVRWMAVAASVVIGLSIVLVFLPGSSVGDDFTFGSENLTKGTSTNPSNRNAEDGAYNVLEEADQYADTNYSGSSENVVTGTAGGGAFPGALDTDDATRRTYSEASSGSGDDSVTLVPTSDVSVGLDTIYPTSPTTHFDKVDEGASHDSGTTYCRAVTNGDKDIYGLEDMSEPSGTYDLDVTIYVICQDTGTGKAYFDAGVVISSTEYAGVNDQEATDSWTSYNYFWEENPAGGEWTYSAINAMNVYIDCYDAAPDVDFTSIYIVVTIDYTDSYLLDAQITFSSVESSAQTTGFQVLCQGYRDGDSEDVKVQAWNYTSTAWVDKVTISAGSDTDYNFNLLGWAANCERSSGNAVLLRLVDTSGDATQTVVYLDMLKVQRIEQGYALDIDMTCSTSPEYGNITLRIKGYTSGEQFNVNVWNYTSAAYDAGKLAITDLSNTWQTTVDLCDDHHRSGQDVKIQFTDETASTADFVCDSLYLDVAWVTRYFTDPTITAYGATPPTVTEAEAIVFFLTYTDYDNQAPSAGYPKVHIDTSDFTMTENNSGDTTYADGKLYYLSKSDLSGGSHDYYFIVDDANSGEVTTTTAQVTVNYKPTLSGDTVLPATGNNGETFSFKVTFTDADGDLPSYIKANIDSTDYDMVEDDPLDVDTTDGKAYHYDKALGGGNHPYYFKTSDTYSGNIQTTEKNVYVNNLPALSGYGRAPADPVYVTTELNFTVTFTDSDNDLPTAVKWRENLGTVQNLSMTQVDPDDLTTTDGKAYFIWVYLGHGSHDYDFWASDSGGGVSGGSNSVTIQNRAPVITNKFVDDHEYRNTYWDYDYANSEDDGDTVTWEFSHNSTFLSINSGTGLVYGTTSDAVGWYTVTVWCNDSYAGSDSDEFILYVDNQAPVITNGPGANPSEYRNIFWEYDFDATDGDTDSLTWAESGEVWLSINPATGYLSGTTPDTAGNYEFTVWANDSYGGSDSYPFTLTISNRVPVITSTGNTTQVLNTFMCYMIVASDADSDVLTYELSTTAPFLAIENNWLNGTATPVGNYEYTIWVNDSYGGSDSEHQNLEVTAANMAPIFDSTPIYSVSNNSAYYYDSNATDPDTPPDPLTYGLETDCGWLEVAPSTGVVSGTPHLAGTYYIHISCTDGTHWVWQNFTFYVNTTAPSFTSAPITDVLNNTLYSYTATATDPESEYLNFSLEGNSSAFLTVGAISGIVSGTPPYVGWYYVNISVFDGVNYDWQNYTLYSNNAPPVIVSVPVTTATPGNNYEYNVLANDPNSDPIYYDIHDTNASWAVIDHNSGEITGVPVLEGIYYVNVTALDGFDLDYQNFTIVVSATAPPEPYDPDSEGLTDSGLTAKFTYTVVGNKIIVEDITAGDITRRQWSFGDGYGSQDARVVHAYREPGYYTITLTVWRDGYYSVAEMTVYIGEAEGWYFDKGEAGFVFGTPYGSFEWDAWISIIVGCLLVIVSLANRKMPLMRSKYWLIVGCVCLGVGVAFYAF